MINYLIHSSILLSAFTLFYWIILREETFFKLNRVTILVSVVISLLLPLWKVPATYTFNQSIESPTQWIEKKITQPIAHIEPTSEWNAADKGNTTMPAAQKKTNWVLILGIIYFTGVLIFGLVFLVQLVVLQTRKFNLNSFKTGKYTIVEMVKDMEPYSFLNTIYINPNNYDPDTYEHIIEHEKIHIDQSHFLDKLLAEVLVIFFWFNPFVWWLRSAISKNLEFLTDQSLLEKGIEKKNYQMSLLKVSVSNQPFNLTMSYNSSFLKNRIKMMNAKKSSVVSSWKYLFILPLYALSIFSLNAVNDLELNHAVMLQTKQAIDKEVKAPVPSNNAKGLVKTFTLSGGGKLDVKTSGGHIKVHGQSGNEVKITANMTRRGTGIEANSSEWNEAIKGFELKMEKKGNTIIAYCKRIDDSEKYNQVSISFEVMTPTNVTGNIVTSGGHIDVRNLDGDQKIHTSGGHLAIEGIKGTLDAFTSGGHINLEDQSGPAEVKTSGGHISIQDMEGDLICNTSGGAISVSDMDGTVDAETSGGQISIKGNTPMVKAVTSGGQITIDVNQVAESIYLKTTGGGITAKVGSSRGMDLDLHGDSVDLDGVSGFKGENDKGRAKGKVNGGGVSVYMHTTSGRIKLSSK